LLLLADEPTGSLDSASGAGVMELLAELNRAGTAVLVITHDRDIAATLPRQVQMRDGRVVADIGGGAGREAGREAGGDLGGELAVVR
jgi:putative ABC transport system ATP-binding protein